MTSIIVVIAAVVFAINGVLPAKHSSVPIMSHERNRRSAEESVATEKTSHLCSRRDMHINLQQLRKDRLVRPASYNAYTCAGKCEASTHSGYLGPFKNHATVRFWHDMVQNNSKPAEFCCVPSAYKGLSVLYYGSNPIKLRHFPNMIITECTCVYKNTNMDDA